MVNKGHRTGEWDGRKCLGAAGEWETITRIYVWRPVFVNVCNERK